MKTVTVNGICHVINETFAESLETINNYFEDMGAAPISEQFARADFGIKGGETNVQLYEWANDYASEVATEKCASKNEWRYSQ